LEGGVGIEEGGISFVGAASRGPSGTVRGV
jgi:hypothetical protein